MSEYIPAQSISPEEQERFKALRQKSLDNLMEYYLNYAQSKSSSNPENHKALEEKLSNIFLGIERAYSLEKWDIYGRYVKILLGDGITGLLTLRGYWEQAEIYLNILFDTFIIVIFCLIVLLSVEKYISNFI